VLFGEVNPSGRLPVTFPASLAQEPRPALDGAGMIEPNFAGETGGRVVRVNYDIEGSDVGYRWFARTHAKPLFPFGYGLSYTRFERGDLRIETKGADLFAHVVVKNIGDRAGADVVQVYLAARAGAPMLRLVGFEKVALQPGEIREATIKIDPRLLADWSGRGWTIKAGSYGFAIGADAEDLTPPVTVALAGRTLRP
jgi:beta-glucosidase